MSRDIALLVPELQTAVPGLLKKCRERGVEMRVFFTLRTPEEQARLYRQSRTIVEINEAIARLKKGGADYLAWVLGSVGPQAGKGEVTKQVPGLSWHNWGEAVDCFVVERGEAVWDGGHWGYRVYAEEARKLGLTPGYYWPSFKDPVHVQFREKAVSAAYDLKEISEEMERRFGNH